MKNVRIVVVGIIFVGLIVGYYYYLSSSSKKTVEDTAEVTEVVALTTKDLDTTYPETPRAVVKLYNRIVCCFYDEEYTDDQLTELGQQARKLMDDELLAKNTEEQYFKDLKADIADYAENSRTISSVTIQNSDNIEYKTVDGDECAYVEVSYFIKENGSFKKTNQEYVLRQNDEKEWKILGFYQIEGDDSASEDE